MPSLKDIKRRIKSVKNTQKITKAMKMVSAAKLKRAQNEINAARPYAEKIQELTQSLASKVSPDSHPLLSPRDGNRIAVVLMTSDRGLCGGFNGSLIRAAERFIRENAEAELSLYLLGKRGGEYFKRRANKIIKSRPIGGGRPSYAGAVDTAKELIDLFLKGELDEVHLIFSQFKSALSQHVVVQKILPISATQAEGEQIPAEEGVEAIFEPKREEVLAELLPKYLEVQVFRSLLETSASEHGARMTSMDSASKNAADMIGGLTLMYNRLRQAAITKELMEIIGGAEALKG